MEEALVQSALEKIRKARARGRNNVNLSQDEVDALERRRQERESIRKRGQHQQRQVPKKNNRLIAAASPSSSRSRGTPKSSRKPSNEQNNAAYTSGSAAAAAAAAAAPPPGFRVAGPDGQPIYAPFGYYPPSDTARHSPTTSRTTSRSTSASSKRQPTPPYDAPHPPGYQSRYYGPPTPDLRPRSSTSTRSDEPPRIPRNRSASSAQQYYADVFGPGPNPAPPGIGSAGGRRNFSGPPDVSYSTLRRVPPASSSPLRASVPVSASDPNLRVGRGSKSALGKESSSSTDEEGPARPGPAQPDPALTRPEPENDPQELEDEAAADDEEEGEQPALGYGGLDIISKLSPSSVHQAAPANCSPAFQAENDERRNPLATRTGSSAQDLLLGKKKMAELLPTAQQQPVWPSRQPSPKNIAIAYCTYQILYWCWMKLESMEEREGKEEEVRHLEGRLRTVKAAADARKLEEQKPTVPSPVAQDGSVVKKGTRSWRDTVSEYLGFSR
ncbi:hypothetical protein H2203_003970 [Taxawa tesnikishii (nom. ined.)]|nr:hypothetical protein H2203_003970 [Dothideales sp. JES 119]